jgi:hypothetical protein
MDSFVAIIKIDIQNPDILSTIDARDQTVDLSCSQLRRRAEKDPVARTPDPELECADTRLRTRLRRQKPQKLIAQSTKFELRGAVKLAY